MKLYGYWRSTASYRVRIALALKGLSPKHVPVHLVRDGGEQHSATYRAINPQGRVPSLVLQDGTVLTQSSAIIEYLDETYPHPPLLPSAATLRARARALAGIIGSDIHPLHNAGVLNYLRQDLRQTDDAVAAWISRWIREGLAAVEALLPGERFCLGPEPGLADVYLIPQVFSARRFAVQLAAYPKILAVLAEAGKHKAFQSAHPSLQIDAEES